jgi:hypothetical protein
VQCARVQKTALPVRFETQPSKLLLPFWTDEGATIVSCTLYVVGNILFIVGSVCFFPKVIAIGGEAIELLAVVLFIVGSCLFTTGAVIDLIVIYRAPRLVRAPSAPQIRGLSLGRWPARAARRSPVAGGAISRVAKIGRGPVKTAPSTLSGEAATSRQRKYLAMHDAEGLASPATDANRESREGDGEGDIELGPLPEPVDRAAPSGGGGRHDADGEKPGTSTRTAAQPSGMPEAKQAAPRQAETWGGELTSWAGR